MTARQELLEAASYLETHGCLPEGLATTAVREVVDPLMPGDKADIVVALQVAAEAGTGSSAPVTAPTPPEVVVETVARAIASEAISVTLVADDEWNFYLRPDEQEDYRRLAAAAIAALPPSPAEEAVKRVEALADEWDCLAEVDRDALATPTHLLYRDHARKARAALASPAPAPQGGGQL